MLLSINAENKLIDSKSRRIDKNWNFIRIKTLLNLLCYFLSVIENEDIYQSIDNEINS